MKPINNSMQQHGRLMQGNLIPPNIIAFRNKNNMLQCNGPLRI